MSDTRDGLPELPIMAPAEVLPRSRRGFAVAAVVAGILSVVSGQALLFAPLAFVFGVLAVRGDGMARLLAYTGMFFAGLATIIVLMPMLASSGFH